MKGKYLNLATTWLKSAHNKCLCTVILLKFLNTPAIYCISFSHSLNNAFFQSVCFFFFFSLLALHSSLTILFSNHKLVLTFFNRPLKLYLKAEARFLLNNNNNIKLLTGEREKIYIPSPNGIERDANWKVFFFSCLSHIFFSSAFICPAQCITFTWQRCNSSLPADV